VKLDVNGTVKGTSSADNAIHGETSAANKSGVYGKHSNGGWGVYGETSGNGNTGVYGYASAGLGVEGHTGNDNKCYGFSTPDKMFIGSGLIIGLFSNPSELLEVHDGNIWIGSGYGYQVGNYKVVGDQGAAVADATSGTLLTQFNILLSRLRAHGLIAT